MMCRGQKSVRVLEGHCPEKMDFAWPEKNDYGEAEFGKRASWKKILKCRIFVATRVKQDGFGRLM